MIAVNLPMDLRAKLRERGRRVAPWSLRYERQITEQDLILLHAVSREAPSAKAPLSAVRDPHHMLARLLAAGKTAVAVSAITGYSTQRIRTLEADPAFRELLAHYSELQVFEQADIQAQIKHVSLTAGQMLQERMEADPDSFSNKELRELFATGLDRIGHGPSSKLNVNINDPAKIIEQVKAELRQEESGRVISRAEIIEVEYTEACLEADQDDQAAPCKGTDSGSGAGSLTVSETKTEGTSRGRLAVSEENS